MFWNALATHFYCKLYKKAVLWSSMLFLIRWILYYIDHLLKSKNSLLLKSQWYKRQKASLLSIQISDFLLYKAPIVSRRPCWFCLPAYIVNIRGIQWVGPSLLNSKINRSKILAKHLLLPQVSMQWPSRISINIQRQHSGKESLQAYNLWQMLLNLFFIYLLNSVSLSLFMNYYRSHMWTSRLVVTRDLSSMLCYAGRVQPDQTIG